MAEPNAYRFLDGIDWAALDGAKVELQCSKNYLQLRTRDGQVLTFGKAKGMRPVPKAKTPEPLTATRNGDLSATAPVDQAGDLLADAGPA